MPLYEYECDACGQRFELIQKFSDPAPAACVKCGKGPVHRQLSSPAIQFKGSGWYITDYAQKGKSDASSSAPGGKSGDKTADKTGEKSGDKSGEKTKSDSSSGDSSSTSKTETKSDSGASGSKSKE